MNKKGFVLIAVILSVSVAIPILAVFSVKPKPKVLIRMDTPLVLTDPGTSKLNGDNIVFKDQVYTEGEYDDLVRLMIFVWEPNPNPPPSHLPPPVPGGPWPVPSMVISGGTVYAPTFGNRDAYTFVGKWHMDFTVTFMIDSEASGFKFRHDCTGVGLVHASSWGGYGFGAFEGVKVSGVSIVDIYEGLQNPPITKTMWGQVTSGFDNLPLPP